MAKLCEKCGGIGLVKTDKTYRGEPIMTQCSCKLKESLLKQCDKAWMGLSQYPAKKQSPLKGKMKECIIISSDKENLCPHLKGAILNEKNPHLFIKVVSDANLMSAWLSNMSLAQSEIFDPDFTRELSVRGLEDLAESPHLLIIRLGVKTARNVAMPEVLVETIELRNHLNKPTWIVVDPKQPLEQGHISWSSAVEEAIDGWNTIRLIEKQETDNTSQVTTLKI